ncbi:hypothetical protein LCL96_15915 [Rossellomorea aquimaris]|uniref:hypothetical protein n=1 Tax=Rossellomorea aquimaris TaxID=189382 RepID=UPI001CD65A9A|nr:hypothetical protein [Rossellomorea aquimaris]MCA1060424.1 hypothetical protein [Rossellomorea aquimaris]
MFKESIRLPLIYFVVKTLYQGVKNGDIRWIENMAICLVMFLFILLWEWAKVPYKRRKTD